MTIRWPSMYRLTSLVLLVIVVSAAGLSAAGIVGFSPEGILATAVLAIAATALPSALGAVIAKSPAHLESSVITGLLIALIVPPTLSTIDLIGTSAAGLIAGASKWILAPGGRHVLNPAATGVAIASLTGLSVGFWWVATPALTPLIIAGGALVAYRSGHSLVVGAFIGLALVLLLTRLLVSGEPVTESLWLAITSYPVIFMGAFMVSEPLTMATRRVDRLIAAVVMAVITAFPLTVSVGGFGFSTSAELALLAGNLVAWALTILRAVRRSASAELVAVTPKSPTVSEYRFRTLSPSPLHMEPGQWVELDLPHHRPDQRGRRRVMTASRIAPATEREQWSFAITTRHFKPGSSWKRALSQAVPGDRLRVTQIGGDFFPPHALVGPMLFVAQGVGITPFVAYLSDAASRELGLEVTLIAITGPSGHELYPELADIRGVERVVLGSLDELSGALPAHPDSYGWTGLSGAPSFVRQARSLLRDAGFRSIHTDQFVGY